MTPLQGINNTFMVMANDILLQQLLDQAQQSSQVSWPVSSRLSRAVGLSRGSWLACADAVNAENLVVNNHSGTQLQQDPQRLPPQQQQQQQQQSQLQPASMNVWC